MQTQTLAVVPARGGSRELRRKNLLPDADGRPLVVASAAAARDAGCYVVVSTDDPEIRSVAFAADFDVMDRKAGLLDGPVDLVVADVVRTLHWDGPVLLVQPTVQPITSKILSDFLRVAGANRVPTALGVEDRHLLWAHTEGIVQVLSDRVERQRAAAWPIRELGVRWWPSSSISSPERVAAAAVDLVDIDTVDDYRTLEKRLSIKFSVAAGGDLGFGHLYRALSLAEGLQHHDVAIQIAYGTDDARSLLDERGWPTDVDRLLPDVVIRDALDLAPSYGDVPTVDFETRSDSGTVSINALYGHGDYSGPKYAVIRPEFHAVDYEIRDDADRVLVVFGGSDPSNLTALVESALPDIDLDVIRPSEKRSIAASMANADLLITSGGRTVYEAAAVGIPAIVLAQNVRETTHQHLGNGNLYLGLGRAVDPYALRRLVLSTLEDFELRSDLSTTSKFSIDDRGADRCRKIIEHVGLFGEKP